MFEEPHFITGSAARIAALKKSVDAHKYSHGHAFILSGGPGATGAARLAARGALRVGAGGVTVGVPPAAQMECAMQLTAIMLARVRDLRDLTARLEDPRLNALCLGPGLGLGEREAGLVQESLQASSDPDNRRSVVLDADALTLIAREGSLFSALHERCVLTPHAGEFVRLFPDLAEKSAASAKSDPTTSKIDATRTAAARAGCTVLLKGPYTVIADPTGRTAINDGTGARAAPWLATAGSGDVLAGYITGLLARDQAPFEAAMTGAWLHTECALSFGPGLIAEDLPEVLPKVFARLGV